MTVRSTEGKHDYRLSFAVIDLPDELREAPELLIRLAIGQIHRRYTRMPRPPHTTETLSLEFAGSPWIGDLFPSPYGGATFGIEEAGHLQVDRDCPSKRAKVAIRNAKWKSRLL